MSDSDYHHGDLPRALLAAVDEVVRERSVGGLTLREVARRAGVSHAAPAHHFGDRAGLLTAYATEGFSMLRDRLSAASRAADDRGAHGLVKLTEIGAAYVNFAMEEPGRFAVMFRPENLRADDPAYAAAGDEAYMVLLDAVRALRDDVEPESPEVQLAATGAWSIAHGLATLWLDGDLPEEITSRPPGEAAEAVLVQFGTTLFAAAGVAPEELTP